MGRQRESGGGRFLPPGARRAASKTQGGMEGAGDPRGPTHTQPAPRLDVATAGAAFHGRPFTVVIEPAITDLFEVLAHMT